MILESPGAIAFKLGNITVHWYGIIIAVAFMASLYIATRLAAKNNENPDNIIDLSSYILLGGVISARLYYVIFNWDYFSRHTEDIIKVWQGGLSIHGALIGVAVIAIAYCKTKKISFLKYADIISCSAILGQAIGRWGNFFNSEAYGMPAKLPISLYIPPELRPVEYKAYEYYHPTFLYESLWNLAVFLLLYFVLYKRLKNFIGAIFFLYLILYSLGRLIIESIRIDNIFSVFGLPIAQFASIVLIITGVIGFYAIFRSSKNRLDTGNSFSYNNVDS